MRPGVGGAVFHKRADRQRNRERRSLGGAAALEVGARDRAADAIEIGRDLAPDVAAIEIIEPDMSELLERCGERRRVQPRGPAGAVCRR